MARCPNCRHELFGIAGAPTEPWGRFTGHVRCPECAYELPAGVQVIHGGVDAAAAVGKLPLASHVRASLMHGIGCSALMGHLLVLVFLAFSFIVSLGIIRGGSVRWEFVVLFASTAIMLFGVIAFWRRFLRTESSGSARIGQIALCMMVMRDRVWFSGRDLGAGDVRAIRVIEQLAATQGGEEVVVSVTPDIATPGLARSVQIMPGSMGARELFIAVPAGAAHRLSAALLATFRGRSDDERLEPPTTICGVVARPGKTLGTMHAIAIGCVVVVLGATLLPMKLAVFSVILVVALLVAKLLSPRGLPSMTRTAWVLADDGVAVAWRDPRPGEALQRRGRSVPRARISRVELHCVRGLPYIELVGAGTMLRACTIAPDDWCGLSPEAYAQTLATRLGVPFHVQIQS